MNCIYQQTITLIAEESQVTVVTEREGGLEEAIAVKLGLKKPPDINVEEYYPTYLNMAKNFMHGRYNIGTRDWKAII